MNITPRTANAALAASILSGTALPAPEAGPWQHGRITTANDSLFTSTHYSEPMTNYAVGWSDPEGYDRLVEFLAPSFPAPGELFEHFVFSNAEEFLSDGTNEDLRAIGSDFKTVDYTPGKTQRKVDNRGLRIELDWDRVKGDPMWQQRYTGKLLNRLRRNQARRALALAIASGTADSLTWSATPAALPEVSLNAQKILAADESGINPNRILIGETAWQTRLACLGSITSGANPYAAAAELARTPWSRCSIPRVTKMARRAVAASVVCATAMAGGERVVGSHSHAELCQRYCPGVPDDRARAGQGRERLRD
jgi:hypothetical protein